MDRRYGRAIFVTVLLLKIVTAEPEPEKSSGWKWKESEKTTTVTPFPADEPITTTDITTLSDNVTALVTDVVEISDLNNDTRPLNGTDAEAYDSTSDISGRSAGGFGLTREGRIINDSGKKLNIKGFIPIVGLDDDDDYRGNRKLESSQSQNQGHSGPYPPQPIPSGQSYEYVDERQKASSYVPQPVYKSPTEGTSGVSYPAPAPSIVQKAVDGYQTLSSQASSGGSNYQSSQTSFKPASSGTNYQSSQASFKPVSSGSNYQEPYGTRISYKPQSLDNNYPTRTVAVSSQSSSGYQGSQGQYVKDTNQDYLKGSSYPPRDPKSHGPSVSSSVARPVYQDQKAKSPPATSSDGRQYFQGQDGIYELAQNGHVQQQEIFDSKEPCICVPFYLCKDGFLSNSARENEGPAVDIDERSARKANVTRRSVPSNDTEIPAYARDIMSRFVGGSNSCGLLRRCCKVPQSGGFENLPPGFQQGLPQGGLPQGFQSGLPQGGLPQGFLQGFQQGGYQVSQQGGYQGSDVASDFQQEYVPVPIQENIQNQHGGSIFQRPLPDGGHPPRRPGQGISVGTFPHRQPQHIQHEQFQGNFNHQGQHQQSINRPVYQPATSIQRPIPQFIQDDKIHRPPVSTASIGPGSHLGHVKPYIGPNHYPTRQQFGGSIHGGYGSSQTYNRPLPHRPIEPQYGGHAGHGLLQKPIRVNYGSCGSRNNYGVHGRVNNLAYREDSTDFGEYPWHVGILKKLGPGDSLYVCGGTLIASQWVITAAHCLKKYNIQDLKIRLGEWDVHREDEFYPHVEKLIGEVIVHPDFFPGNLKDDVALLRLDTPVDLNQPHIAAACLPELHEHFTGQKCFVTGWGKDAFGNKGEYQNVLKEVDVPVIDHRDCEYRLKQTRLGPGYRLDKGFVCAGGEPGKDACTGDGGSPLVCEDHGVWKLAGIVSWGIGCGQAGVPGVYVNVAKYREWIDSIVGHYG